MSNKFTVLVFYSLSALVYTYSLFHNFVHCMFPEHNGNFYESTKDKLKYLTTWDSVMKLH